MRLTVGAAALALAGAFVGCQQISEPTAVDPATTGPEVSSESESLGKRNNPYTVATMMQARDSLVARGDLPERLLTDEDFTPTHYYIRFKPANEDEYRLLDYDSSLVLWDFPLDTVLPEGLTSYRDSGIPDSAPCYQYVVVEVDQALPQVEYETLAHLLLSDRRQQAALTKSVSFWDSYEMLEHEALRITGNAPVAGGGMGKAQGKWRPSGNIMVWDETLRRNVPILGVEVRVRNWFRSWQGYTDANGNFRSGEKFRGDVSYFLKWEYKDELFDIRNGGAGQAFYNGPNDSWDPWNLVISSGMSRVYAHIFRVGAFYIAQEPYGLSDRPFDRVSVQAHDGKCPAGTPSKYTYGNENIDMWSKDHSGNLWASIRLFRMACHEFAHAQHDEMYEGGSCYNDVDKIVRESWAEAVEGFFTRAEYGVGERHYLQHYTFTAMREEHESVYTPVLIDLIDWENQRFCHSVPDELPDMPLDCVSGYTLAQIESCLKTAKTLGDVKNLIKSFANPTKYFVDELISQFEVLQPAPTPGRVGMQPGFELRPGLPTYSSNARYMVVFQHDGNLVVYDTQPATWVNVWNSGTYNRGGVRCVFQNDKNLVIYNAQNQPVWASNTSRNPRWTGELAIEDNGALAIRAQPGAGHCPVWAVYRDWSTTF